MNPDRAALVSDRCYEGIAVRRDSDALLFGRVECDLLQRAVREGLPPEVRSSLDRRLEVHRAPVRRPGRRTAKTLRSDKAATGAAIKWNEPAPLGETSARAHLDNEDRFAVRRGVREMRHGALVFGKVNLP